jgi:NADPH:quinone reductase-like Zn-dependent oxidoreductase
MLITVVLMCSNYTRWGFPSPVADSFWCAFRTDPRAGLSVGSRRPFGRSATYRIIFDAVGMLRFAGIRSLLTRDGVYVATVPSTALFWEIVKSAVGYPRARLVAIRSRTEDLESIAGLVRAGKLRPVVDRVFDFEAVIQAFRYLELRHARGKVIVRVA